MSALLGHPNLLALVLFAGILLIYLEANRPGLILPGSLGLFLVLYALHGFSLLPVSITATCLAVAGFCLAAGEAWVPVHGVFGVPGAVLLAVGLRMLLPRSVGAIAWPTAIGIAFPLAFLTSWLAVVARTASRNKRTLRRGTPGAAIH